MNNATKKKLEKQIRRLEKKVADVESWRDAWRVTARTAFKAAATLASREGAA